MRDTTQRLAPLFYEVGLLAEDEASRIVPAGQRTVYDILKAEVSVRAVKELFTVDLLGSVQKSRPLRMEGMLYRPLTMSGEEIRYLLRENQVEVRPLLDEMVKAGLLSSKRREEFNEVAGSVSRSEADVALDGAFLTPDVLVEMIVGGKSEAARLGHMFIAVDLLVYNRVVTKKDAQEALELYTRDGTSIARTLRERKAFEPSQLVDAINKGMYFPTVSLDQTTAPEALLFRFPESLLQRESFIPFRRRGQTVNVALPDPLNFAVCDLIALLTGLWVSPYFAPQEEVLSALAHLFASQRVRSPGFIREDAEGIPSRPKSARPAKPSTRLSGPARPPSRAASHGVDTPEAAVPAPRATTLATSRVTVKEPSGPVDSVSAVHLVSTMIETAVEAHATDIHVEPGRESTRVRLRIDGVLHNAMSIPEELTLACVSRIKVLANMNVTERRRPQDGHFSLPIAGSSYDFRVSILPTHLGEKVVIRILDASSMSKGIEELGFWPEQRKCVERLLEYPYGMLLTVGPTGAGKTSTLYAMLRSLNSVGVNIVTIEDPIEYELQGISQVQVDENLGLGFASGLRSVLRQDPDIIMVGEIRDEETARIAVRAAITGHFVLSTLHSNTAASTVSTLLQMKIPSYLISASLLGVISQRLIRKNCRKCSRKVAPDGLRLEAVGLKAEDVDGIVEGKGCDQCFQSGYLGRTGLFEVLVMDEKLRKAVATDGSEDSLLKIAKKTGMVTLQDVARRAVKEGITTPEEIANILLPGA